MELDHKDHSLALQNWILQSYNTFMEFVLFGQRRKVNSYPALKDGKYSVQKFLNRKVKKVMWCLDNQELSDDPTFTEPNDYIHVAQVS